MEANPPLIEAGTHPPPTEVGNWPPQAEVGSKPPQGVQLTCPQREKEQAMAGHGMNGPSGGLEGKQASPKALHTRLGPRWPGGRLSAKFTIMWLVKSHLPAMLPQRLFGPIYPGIEAQTLKTWACQVLCMISEYHMACVTRGSSVTSPILPGVIEDKLPPLTGYTLPEDRLGVTDVQVRDHQAKTLQVAVWLHRLDMALNEEPAASGSLVRARHSLSRLLAYFLAPGTTWGLQFEDVVDQVLWENRKQNKRRRNESSSSLRKCRSRRTKLRDEFDAVSKTMEVTTDGWARKEMEQRLAALQTSLSAVENSITKFKNIIEDCWMVEEELRWIEEDEARQEEEEEEETTNIEMVNKEEHSNPESSGPRMEANTEDIPPLVSGGDTISPEEEAILLGGTPQPEDSATGSHSPRSKTTTVSGGMAELCLTSPSHPGLEEDETPQ